MGLISDLHCGSSVGLHPYDATTLDDGGQYVPSEAQCWLYDHWRHYLDTLKAAAAGTDLHVILNGDLVDGDHHGTTQIVSRHPNVQLDILKRCIEPLLALRPKTVTVVRGTEVHVGPSGSAEESFAKWLVGRGVTVPPGEHGNASHWHFRGEYGGVLVDATHHGRVGGRPWTRPNATNGLAAEIVMEHAERGERIPDLCVRSHFHQWVDTGDNYRTRVIQTPSFQLATAYVKRRHAEGLADVGAAIARIDDGQIVALRKVVATPERPKVFVA